jgi:hypothetical protein
MWEFEKTFPWSTWWVQVDETVDSSSGRCMLHAVLSSLFHTIHVVLQCRSFGDLTSLNSEDYNSNHFQHVYVSNLTILFKFFFSLFHNFLTRLCPINLLLMREGNIGIPSKRINLFLTIVVRQKRFFFHSPLRFLIYRGKKERKIDISVNSKIWKFCLFGHSGLWLIFIDSKKND